VIIDEEKEYLMMQLNVIGKQIILSINKNDFSFAASKFTAI
jgi:hypothetical protein